MKPVNGLSAASAKAAKQNTVEVSQQWDMPAFTRFMLARCKGLEPLTYWFVANLRSRYRTQFR